MVVALSAHLLIGH